MKNERKCVELGPPPPPPVGSSSSNSMSEMAPGPPTCEHKIGTSEKEEEDEVTLSGAVHGALPSNYCYFHAR